MDGQMDSFSALYSRQMQIDSDHKQTGNINTTQISTDKPVVDYNDEHVILDGDNQAMIDCDDHQVFDNDTFNSESQIPTNVCGGSVSLNNYFSSSYNYSPLNT